MNKSNTLKKIKPILLTIKLFHLKAKKVLMVFLNLSIKNRSIKLEWKLTDRFAVHQRIVENSDLFLHETIAEHARASSTIKSEALVNKIIHKFNFKSFKCCIATCKHTRLMWETVLCTWERNKKRKIKNEKVEREREREKERDCCCLVLQSRERIAAAARPLPPRPSIRSWSMSKHRSHRRGCGGKSWMNENVVNWEWGDPKQVKFELP